MCLGSLNLIKKKKNNGKKNKKGKKDKDKNDEQTSRSANISNISNSSPSNENEIKEKLNDENRPIQENQENNKEKVENEIKEIIIQEQNLVNENQPVQEKQKIKENVENDISSSIASSSAQPQISTPAPPITLTPPNTTTEEDDIQTIPSNEREVLKVVNFSDMGVGRVTGIAALQIFKTSLAAAKPFFPWIESVTTLINEIVNQYDTVEYNKKTCLILIERVEMIGLSIKNLSRRREENLEKFQNENYYHSLIRLHKVLKLVKEFIGDISQLKGYRKFILASEVKDKANQLLSKLDASCNDLQFAIIISEESRIKEQQSLDDDVVNMTNFLKSIEKEITIVQTEGKETNKVLNRIYENVSVIHQMITEISDSTKETLLNVPKIDPKDLYEDPKDLDEEPEASESTPNKNKHLRKRLLRNAIPVACIVYKPECEPKRVHAHLSILNSVQSSNRIIKFHGKSEIKGDSVLVFDWANHGNLKKLYEQKKISWVNKLDIAHDIASGLVFLQACNILHHDIKCENILITADIRYEAKIANFQESRETGERSRQIQTYNDIIRWLAPEKIPKDKKPSSKPYTFKCEIFSFAMLLWELGAQKVPYEKMEMDDIITHVMAKKRENFKGFHNTNNGLDPANNEPIIKGFIRIIESAWVHESSQRPTINDIYQELDGLVGVHSPRIRPQSSSSDVIIENSNNNSNESITTTEWEDDDHFETVEPILALEEGIKAHREKRIDDAWKCFEIHATLGDSLAKYWQAYYYMKGYVVEKNTAEAIKCFKQAADANIPEAQFQYASAIKKAKRTGFLEYFAKAAENGYPMAQYELGLIYYYGSDEIEKNDENKEKGIQYLKLAALKGNTPATKELDKIDPNILNHDQISN